MVDVVALRAKLSWSQAQMAEYLGCHQSTIHRIEDGQPMPGTIRRLLDRLDVLIVDGLALPGQPVSHVVALSIGRSSAILRPVEPQSA